MATLVITAGFFKEENYENLSHDTEILPNDTEKKN